MPVFTIEAPDGSKVKVEADTPELAMQGAQEAFTQKTKGAEPEESGDVSIGSVARSLFRGLPLIGTYRDELAARGRSLVGQDYEEGLAKERGRDKAFSDKHPVLDTGLGILGGVGGTLLAAPAVGGAGAAGAVGRTVLGLGAKTLPGAIARGAVAGGIQGAAAGSGDAEGGFVDRAMGGLQGGAIGGVLGGALPAGFEFGRRGVSAIIDKAVGNGDALSGLSGAARRYVGQLATPTAVNSWEQDLARLGPDAMLADVSPEWQMVAGGAAARPGSRETVVGALTERDAGKNQRLANDLNRTLGPAEVPSEVDAGIRGGQEALGDNYRGVFQGARAIDSQPLADHLDASLVNLRGASRQAVERVRGWLNIPGTNQLDPNPGALFQVRHEIDGLLTDETNPRVIENMTAVRREVDRMLAQSVPGLKDVDGFFAELARQREALARGSQVLDSGKTAPRPAEIVNEVQQNAQPQGNLVGPSAANVRLRQGTRAEIDRVAGQNANDPVALQRLVKGEGDWNRDKLRTIFGQGPADEALGAIDREAQFRNTHNRVTAGSDTAPRRAFQEALDRVENGAVLGGSPGADVTGMGLIVKGARTVGAMLMGELGKARANRFATELARVSIAQGVSRDELVAAMRQAGIRQQTIGRVLDHATRTGLIASREVPQKVLDNRNRAGQ
jgi:hypothetical protein